MGLSKECFLVRLGAIEHSVNRNIRMLVMDDLEEVSGLLAMMAGEAHKCDDVLALHEVGRRGRSVFIKRGEIYGFSIFFRLGAYINQPHDKRNR